MLVWQNRLNRDYAFEIVHHEIWSEGRGRIRNKYTFALAADSDDAKMFQGLLALKMIEKAKRLLAEIDADVDVQVYVGREDETGDDQGGEDETGDEYVEEYVALADWELEYNVFAGFESMADVDVEDVRWSFRRWLKGRRGKRNRHMASVPDLEVDVLAGIEVETYGTEDTT